MPVCRIQASQGDDRVVCKSSARVYPHGVGKPYVDKQITHLIRAHRGKLCSYVRHKTDCQWVKVVRSKKQGSSTWETEEEALALSLNPDKDGKFRLRCSVPEGPCKGNQYWSRLVVFFWHRKSSMSWHAFCKLKLEANHLNLNPKITLVDELAICSRPENIRHYLESEKFKRLRKRPASNL